MTLKNAGYQFVETCDAVDALNKRAASDEGKENSRDRGSGRKVWIVKPFKPETMLMVIKKIIG